MALWQRDREIAGLKSDIERMRSQVWRFSMDLLDNLGLLERELKDESGSGFTGLRRMISRLKGVMSNGRA